MGELFRHLAGIAGCFLYHAGFDAVEAGKEKLGSGIIILTIDGDAILSQLHQSCHGLAHLVDIIAVDSQGRVAGIAAIFDLLLGEALGLAILVRGNMPIAVSLVWLTNPFTMPPVFYCTYQMGAWLMQIPPRTLPEELTFEWITDQLSTLWQPFLLGSVVCGVLLGALAYCLTMLYWRWWVGRQWRRRKHKSAAHSSPTDQ